ncbi:MULTISPECIES: DUF2510 domain-containing protein [Mycobacterium]|uniref:DUF2510 domain-containing protein n=1 Tax=Mycobacterium kiyosense TaxID=2871094 RepID=A0A9P3Q4U8_9MYCO|nr:MULTISPECIES: DUF2510 domain-containing protein [Mycobacterium]BDB40502.1 hypothetical protein IWGMT90018_09480 [Mycobacterium kiyosense]BDE12320.1 hypothetical protein MKCMC460_11800 [Mycobacterium sp. 20KCMC460]GLB85873.1 hypothetical protein SRL2020028_51290 [Mycobacterium kiyosense]GLB88558.1 hypothetical protein SRL2020130_13750 [Mycobacterium kiyosense]GLB94813.1 hypothetical protein SRL2020226_15890 [Mycobacterium kiyosense]
MHSNTPSPGWYPDPSGVPGQRFFDGRQWTYRQPPPPPAPAIIINNNVGTPPPVVLTGGPNHALHLVLTLLTCGMWLPIWLIVAIASPSRPRVAGQSNTGLIIAGVFGGLFLLGVAVSHPAVFLGVVALAGLGYLGYRAYERALDRRAEQARIAARADGQHQAFLSGEPWGIYGQYPPAPPPPR